MKARASFWSDYLPKSWILLRKGYTFRFFKHDLIAGITVGVIALPLAMAFAMAAGLPPQKGIYTAIVAGFLISLLGGSRLQIGGPTGAFAIILYNIVNRVGYDGLVLVCIAAGFLLIIAAFLKFGRFMRLVPYPVITGFTSGLAVAIFSSQIKDFLGLTTALPPSFLGKWHTILHTFHDLHLLTFYLSLFTLATILLLQRYFPKIPWGIAAVVLATAVTYLFNLPVATIASRFGEIPSTLPTFQIPKISSLQLPAFFIDTLTVAFLAGVEALLSATVADRMAGTQHKPNSELLAQGLANITSALFGGIPATGAIARTAANIKSGAKTPIAGMIHALTLLSILLLFAPLVSKIPLGALSAILIVVAWNMSELTHFIQLCKAPIADILTLLTTFFLTILVDLTAGVTFGILVAIIFSLKNLRQKIKIEKTTGSLPLHIDMYEVEGPLYFGSTDSLKAIPLEKEILILQMQNLSFIDASGMHALQEFQKNCKNNHTRLFLCGLQEVFLKKLEAFGASEVVCKEIILKDTKEALSSLQKIYNT